MNLLPDTRQINAINFFFFADCLGYFEHSGYSLFRIKRLRIVSIKDGPQSLENWLYIKIQAGSNENDLKTMILDRKSKMLFLVHTKKDDQSNLFVVIEGFFLRSKKRAKKITECFKIEKQSAQAQISRIEFPYILLQIDDYYTKVLVVDFQSGERIVIDGEPEEIQIRPIVPDKYSGLIRHEENIFMRNNCYAKEVVFLTQDSDSFQLKFGSFYAITDHMPAETSPRGSIFQLICGYDQLWLLKNGSQIYLPQFQNFHSSLSYSSATEKIYCQNSSKIFEVSCTLLEEFKMGNRHLWPLGALQSRTFKSCGLETKAQQFQSVLVSIQEYDVEKQSFQPDYHILTFSCYFNQSEGNLDEFGFLENSDSRFVKITSTTFLDVWKKKLLSYHDLMLIEPGVKNPKAINMKTIDGSYSCTYKVRPVGQKMALKRFDSVTQTSTLLQRNEDNFEAREEKYPAKKAIEQILEDQNARAEILKKLIESKQPSFSDDRNYQAFKKLKAVISKINCLDPFILKLVSEFAVPDFTLIQSRSKDHRESLNDAKNARTAFIQMCLPLLGQKTEMRNLLDLQYYSIVN